MFQVGDRVRTRLMNPAGHTRLPVYLRGRVGKAAKIKEKRAVRP